MMKLRYTLNSAMDAQLFSISFISLIEEISKHQHEVVIVTADEQLRQSVSQMLQDKFSDFKTECLATHDLEGFTDIKVNSIVFPGAFSKAEGKDVMTCTKQTGKELGALIESMETTCVIPPKILVFEDENQQEVAGIMYQVLGVCLRIFEASEMIMSSIQEKLRQPSQEEQLPTVVEEVQE